MVHIIPGQGTRSPILGTWRQIKVFRSRELPLIFSYDLRLFQKDFLENTYSRDPDNFSSPLTKLLSEALCIHIPKLFFTF